MYSAFSIFKKYLRYYFLASNGKGHGIHSPFVFNFIKNVLRGENNHSSVIKIEEHRRNLLNSDEIIEVEDFGAGSRKIKNNKRTIKSIAKTSLKSKKYASLLSRIVNYYQPENIIELGTSLGITTAYLASARTEVYTIEGSKGIANNASMFFEKSGFNNIQLFVGKFEDKLPEVLSKMGIVSLAYVDGDHRKTPTLKYFNLLKNNSDENSIIILDDIYWSKEMEEAWNTIKNDSEVTLSIDLFFIGLIFFRKDFKVKQHFTIRF